MYNKSSAREMGTLYQLRNLVNRTGVKSDPSQCMKAAEDFFTVVLYTYVIAAARKIIAKSAVLPSYTDVAKQVVRQYITLNWPDSSASQSADKGSTYGYGLDILNLGFLWYGFHDSVREGDGDRIIRYCRFLLPVFHYSG